MKTLTSTPTEKHEAEEMIRLLLLYESLQEVPWWCESSYGNVMAKAPIWDNASIDPVIPKLVTEASLAFTQQPYCYREDHTIKKVGDFTLLPTMTKAHLMHVDRDVTHCRAALALRNEGTEEPAPVLPCVVV